MTATLEVGRPEAVARRATLVPLAARELRRFVLNPVFLFAVAITGYALWAGPGTVTEIDTANPYPAIFLGFFQSLLTT